MIFDRRIARRYALALGELAREQNIVAQVETDLQTVLQTLADNEDFRRILEHQRITPARKRELLNTAYSGRISDLCRDFLFLLVDKRRESVLPEIYAEFHAYADDLRDVVEVEVRTAKALGDGEMQALEEKLVGMTGRKVRIAEISEPELLGGVVVRVGDLVMDGSVATRLVRLHETLQRTQIKNVG